MGKVFINAIGSQGADPEEVTARADDVLEGKTSIDNSGEVVRGTIKKHNSGKAAINAELTGDNKLEIAIEKGAYLENARGKSSPSVLLDNPKLKQALGLDSIKDKMLKSASVAGVQGTIENKTGTIWAKSVNLDSDNDLATYIPRGAYLQNSSNGNAKVYVSKAKLQGAVGVNNIKNKMLNNSEILGVRGTIPISKTNNNHVKTSNEGFMYYNDRSREWQYVMRVDRGQFIDDYDWVGRREEDIKAENIREGKTIAGIRGTLKDLTRGRVVFNGATFDGELVSGVADPKRMLETKGFCGFNVSDDNMPDGRQRYILFSDRYGNNHFGNEILRDNKLPGIVDGGLMVRTKCTKYWIDDLEHYENHQDYKIPPYGDSIKNVYFMETHCLAGYTLKNSIDLEPFSRLKVGYIIRDYGENHSPLRPEKIDDPYNRKVHPLIEVTIAVISTQQAFNHYGIFTDVEGYRMYKYRVIGPGKRKTHGTAEFLTLPDWQGDPYRLIEVGRQKWLEMDIREFNGHFYIAFGAVAERGRGIAANVIFNHIELIN